ncbi:potassium transporter TrkG [Faecalibaculum rodentium]|nr:potassium transporter TrkG [Faecalibaculum rodentium]
MLVLLLTVLPKTSEQAMHLIRAEAPGPSISKLVPRLSTSAMILYGLYLFLSVLEFCFLFFGGMPLSDALVHTFDTTGTGGFSLYADSIPHSNSVYFEAVITVFMFLFGVNFNLYFFLVIREFTPVVRGSEFCACLGIAAGSILLVALNILPLYRGLSQAFRHASFQVVSVMITTGYATADFGLWPTFSRMILFFLMVVEAMAGSTGGSVKVARILVVFRALKLNIQKPAHPQKVEALTLGICGVERGNHEDSCILQLLVCPDCHMHDSRGSGWSGFREHHHGCLYLHRQCGTGIWNMRSNRQLCAVFRMLQAGPVLCHTCRTSGNLSGPDPDSSAAFSAGSCADRPPGGAQRRADRRFGHKLQGQ